MAGRSMPSIILMMILAIAISAPVLPAETTQSASPWATASMARRIDERRPLRSATEGLASSVMNSSVWRICARSASLGSCAKSGFNLASSPKSWNCASGKRSRAMAAPFTTMAGACSPPIASSAMTSRLFKRRLLPGSGASRRFRRRRADFAAVVLAAGGTNVMRPLQLAAIGAFDVARRLQRMMRTAHIAARGGCLLLWNCHGNVSESAPAGRAAIE